jgi:RNA polymerase sigma factor (sigma-70 family)
VAPSTPVSEDIYLEHAPVLRRVAIRKFGIPADDAEALVHDVFINFLVMPRQINRDLRRYLIGAICNARKNYWRARRCEERTLAAAEQASEREMLSDDLLAGLSTNMLVAATLARLSPRCREALRRYYLHGEETAEVAAAMNTSAANVNYLMHVCRKRARTIYQELVGIS